MKSLKNLFDALEGQWILTRRIDSHGVHGTFNGTAVFKRETDNILLYHEQGHIDFNGYRGEASRQYRYVLDDDNILIYYDDGEQKGTILHQLSFTHGNGFASSRHCHVCGNDSYTLTMTIRPYHSIVMDYKVEGANKNYTLSSLLTTIRLVNN